MKGYKLPYDVTINHMTFKKGVDLELLINTATRWHTELMELKKLPEENVEQFKSIFMRKQAD